MYYLTIPYTTLLYPTKKKLVKNEGIMRSPSPSSILKVFLYPSAPKQNTKYKVYTETNEDAPFTKEKSEKTNNLKEAYAMQRNVM